MPQLVKGGKYAFGWSRVGDQGQIIISPEVLGEYGLMESEKLFLIPGSRTSGGFGLASQESLRKSPLRTVAEINLNMEIPQGEVVEYKGKPYCWVELLNGGITVSAGTLERYGVRIGDRLLVIRGSGLAVGFAVRGRSSLKPGDILS
jgi:hypothetical protein